MAYRLIIEENTIYEIDETCEACKAQENRGNDTGEDQDEKRKRRDSYLWKPETD